MLSVYFFLLSVTSSLHQRFHMVATLTCTPINALFYWLFSIGRPRVSLSEADRRKRESQGQSTDEGRHAAAGSR